MLLIRNAKILTMEDQDYLDGGDILVDEGKILAVGADLPAPDAEVFNARGMYAMPGIVDAHSHIGMWEDALGLSLIHISLGAFVPVAARVGRLGQAADHGAADAGFHGAGELRGRLVDGKLQEGVFLVVFAVSLAQGLQLCRAWPAGLFVLHMRRSFVMQMLYICDAYNDYTICHNKEKSQMHCRWRK